MGIDLDAIMSEMQSVRSALRLSWRTFAEYCRAKMAEQAVNGGSVASYSIGGRTVTRDLRIWQAWHDYAIQQASREAGGIAQCPIYFRSHDAVDDRGGIR